MTSEAEKFKRNHAGLIARSTQGHAAKGMKIKDQEDMWVSIQHNTFRNWVNVQLRDSGLRVEDLSEDLKDGVALVTLVETLQKRKLRKVKNVSNQHQALENVTTALNAIDDDGIKLVNIGNVDIVNGNLKLILGLIWSLIMHYQIGQTHIPPKKLMLAWLKGVLPNCDVHNFTADWNDGVNLSALINYCDPKLLRHWKSLDPANATQNCRKAMEVARKEFNIPMVLEPEYLASPYLDDLSGMTYLSYFMKDGGPGYKATLDWVRKTLPEKNIRNFTTDWNDGHNLATLVRKFGGSVPGYKNMSKDRYSWEDNIKQGLNQGKKLGVEPVLEASDMARPDVEYLGPMAYLSYYQWLPQRKCPTESVSLKCDMDNIRVNTPLYFRVDFSRKEVDPNDLRVDVRGPSGPVRLEMDSSVRGAKGSFIPEEVGFYDIEVILDDEHVDGSPHRIRVLPDVSKILFSGIDPCALGSIVEVLINSNGAGGGEISVVARSPANKPHRCPVKVEDGVYTATFQPDEAGEWGIEVTYDDEHIHGSPFTCHVYDPNAIKVYNLEKGPYAKTSMPFTIILDTLECGWGDAQAEITLGGVSQPSHCIEVERSLYEVTFTPYEVGRYKVYVYYNGHEVKESPYHLFLGIDKPDKKDKKKKSKDKLKNGSPVVKEYTSTVDSPFHNNNNKSSFYKTFDSSNYSSTKFHSLRKSYESNLNKSDSSHAVNYSSLKTTKISSFNKSSDNILSKDYSKTLEKFRDPTRTLEFDFPTSKTTFEVPVNECTNPHLYTSSLKRRTSRGRDDSFNRGSRNVTSEYRSSSYDKENRLLKGQSPPFSPISPINNTFNSLNNSSRFVDTGYSSLKKTSFTSFDKRTRTSSSSNQSNYLSDERRSPKALRGRSPFESPRQSPMRQTPPRSSPFRHSSPVPDDRPRLSSPTHVQHASVNKPRTEDWRTSLSYMPSRSGSLERMIRTEEYEEFKKDVSEMDKSTIKTMRKVYKSEERLLTSSPSYSSLPPLSPRSPNFHSVQFPISPSTSSSSFKKHHRSSSHGINGIDEPDMRPSSNSSRNHYSSTYREDVREIPIEKSVHYSLSHSPSKRSPPNVRKFQETYRTWERQNRDYETIGW